MNGDGLTRRSARYTREGVGIEIDLEPDRRDDLERVAVPDVLLGEAHRLLELLPTHVGNCLGPGVKPGTWQRLVVRGCRKSVCRGLQVGDGTIVVCLRVLTHEYVSDQRDRVPEPIDGGEHPEELPYHLRELSIVRRTVW